MSIFFTDAQMAVARESYDFWRTKTDHEHACALLGNEAGETGFVWKKGPDGRMFTPSGDHNSAFGTSQWHRPRAALILKHTRLDVIKGTHKDMLYATYAEMTEEWSSYKHVWPAFENATTMWGSVTVLVSKFEQSGQQASDIFKRSAIAAYFDHVLTS